MLLLHRPVVRLATGDCLAPSFAWVCFTFTRPPPACHNLVNRTSMTMIGTTAEVYSATRLASGRRRDNLITRSSARALLLLDSATQRAQDEMGVVATLSNLLIQVARRWVTGNADERIAWERAVC